MTQGCHAMPCPGLAGDGCPKSNVSVLQRLRGSRANLNEGSQQGGDITLVRLQVALQEGVEVEEDESVHAHHT